MIEYFVVKFSGKGIGDVIFSVLHPVFSEFFRCQNENICIFEKIIFNHRERSECFSETYAIGEDTSIILFYLFDGADHGIALEIV